MLSYFAILEAKLHANGRKESIFGFTDKKMFVKDFDSMKIEIKLFKTVYTKSLKSIKLPNFLRISCPQSLKYFEIRSEVEILKCPQSF